MYANKACLTVQIFYNHLESYEQRLFGRKGVEKNSFYNHGVTGLLVIFTGFGSVFAP